MHPQKVHLPSVHIAYSRLICETPTLTLCHHLCSCWSMVGDQQEGQLLSLGPGCDHKAVIEHELLHALGFYHEQSRQDRDDYVNIHLDQVTDGLFLF